ncbi:3'-5' exonuclease [Desulfotalea psychrophila]|uniref:Probable DNA polymerase III, epsilon chain n=1 Tax=Desulfotalea psychrophila (strain LSv54 / DSM 12343) TaxID=177439 RepID=Q6APN0_DESPS|nr:3'-5' exonuclease [Desulfotalea psychrophila]CAG35694.1 probable DNA polymerase III, epsilon chain [Desulfotalea psychrophila LSv54]
MMPSFKKSRPRDWPSILAEKAKKAKDPGLKKFYSAYNLDVNTPLQDIPFVALDFETTGLDLQKDGILSIGLIPFDTHRIYCKKAAYWVINPHSPLGEDSVIIHGITHSDINNAPGLGKVWQEVLNELAGKIVVVHYREIERKFLDKALHELLGEGIAFPVIDTMQIESIIQQKKRGGLWNWLKGRHPESIRLANSRSRYGLPHYQVHHALTDAIATAELLQAQIAHHYSDETPISTLWL